MGRGSWLKPQKDKEAQLGYYLPLVSGLFDAPLFPFSGVDDSSYKIIMLSLFFLTV
jgi:hypothetical protein